jgi:acetyl-CoA carboxylase biotin carboxyl carrier protein
VDLKLLHDVLDVLEGRDVAELEWEEGGTRLRVRRREAGGGAPGMQATVAPPMMMAAPVVPTAAAAPPATVAAAAAAASAEEEGLVVVTSPIVGTFYRAPDPNSPAFVNVGDHVRVGQVLCIVEAMKLMNEIEAEQAGAIVKIHQENGQPVQYGAPLFTIRP